MSRSNISAETFECPRDMCRWEHSKQLDRHLGYKISRIEQLLSKKYRAFNKPTDNTNSKKHFTGSQVWVGLNSQTLQTPYTDILCVLRILKPYRPRTIVDLGAGYGRVGVVSCSLFPNGTFTGVEILSERFHEAVRIHKLHKLQHCEMIQQDLISNSFQIPSSEVYFIYDFSHSEDIEYVLRKVFERNHAFFIVAVGETINRILLRRKCSLLNRKFDDLAVYQFGHQS